MQKFTYHGHTKWSDGTATIDEAIETAISKGRNNFVQHTLYEVIRDFRAECLPKIKKVFTDLCGENAEIDKTSNLIEIGYSDIEFSGILASYYSNISVIDASGELVEQAKKA